MNTKHTLRWALATTMLPLSTGLMAAEPVASVSAGMLAELALLLVALVLGFGVVARRKPHHTEHDSPAPARPEASAAPGAGNPPEQAPAPLLRLIRTASAQPQERTATQPPSSDITPPKRTA